MRTYAATSVALAAAIVKVAQANHFIIGIVQPEFYSTDVWDEARQVLIDWELGKRYNGRIMERAFQTWATYAPEGCAK